MASSKNKLVVFLLAAVGLLVLPLILQHFGNAWVRIADLALLYIMLALGLNIVVGYAGLLDLGYVAFYAVGAYLFALLASPHLIDTFPAIAATFPNGLHLPLWAVIPIAAALAGIVGVLLGYPLLKLRGDYLAIVTLGFGEIIRIFLNNLDHPVNLTNGPKGIGQIDSVQIFGLDLGKRLELFGYDISSVTLYYYLFLVLLVVSIVICYRLQDSRVGRAWEALREDEIACHSLGLNPMKIKLSAFTLGAMFAGFGGAFFAARQGIVNPESFTFIESALILAIVVLGGMGSQLGVILAAIILTVLPEMAREFSEYRMLIFGLVMILMMIWRPQGLLPMKRHQVEIKA